MLMHFGSNDRLTYPIKRSFPAFDKQIIFLKVDVLNALSCMNEVKTYNVH